jgi:hypothetical protein
MIGVEPSLLTEPPITPSVSHSLAEYSDVTLYAPKLSTRSKRKRQRRPAMKKISTSAAKQTKNLRDQRLISGLDPGDHLSVAFWTEPGKYCLEQKLRTTPKAMKEVFRGMV